MDESSRRSAAISSADSRVTRRMLSGARTTSPSRRCGPASLCEAIHRRIWLRACAVSTSSMPGTQQTRSALAAGAKTPVGHAPRLRDTRIVSNGFRSVEGGFSVETFQGLFHDVGVLQPGDFQLCLAVGSVVRRQQDPRVLRVDDIQLQ